MNNGAGFLFGRVAAKFYATVNGLSLLRMMLILPYIGVMSHKFMVQILPLKISPTYQS